MTPITVTPDWLRERADIHDGFVVDLRIIGGKAEIELEDEWVSMASGREHGHESPGVLIAENFSVISGEPYSAVGGRIREISLKGDLLELTFSNRPKLALRTGSVRWRSSKETSED